MSTVSNSRPHRSMTRASNRYVPPYTSSEISTWSPGFSVSSSVVVAPRPLEKQRPFEPPSSEASTCCKRLARRVAGARVVPRLRLADRLLRVRRGLVDRDVDRAELGVGVLAGVDRPRLEPHRVLAHRISGGIAHLRRCSSSTASCPRRARAHSADLRLASCPGANSRPVSAVHPGSPQAHAASPGSEGWSRSRVGAVARRYGCAGSVARRQDDLALLRVAGRAEPAFEREQARERRERGVHLVGRAERARVDRLREQDRPPPRVRAHALRRQEPRQHHRRRVREHLDRRPLHGPAAVPRERVLDRAERLEPDRHPLVEGVLGHLRIRRRVEALDPEPPQLAFGQAGAARRGPRRGRVDRHDVGSEIGRRACAGRRR